jgi:hypothetical protein
LNTRKEIRTDTIAEIRISRVFKGKHQAGDTIEVAQEGDGENMIYTYIENLGYLQTGDQVILFLSCHDSMKEHPAFSKYRIFHRINAPLQAQFIVEDNQLISRNIAHRNEVDKYPYKQRFKACKTVDDFIEFFEIHYYPDNTETVGDIYVKSYEEKLRQSSE